MDFKDVFKGKPLIGMIHLPALPGSPRSELGVEELVDYALEEEARLSAAGVDAVIVENVGDTPLLKHGLPPYVVACMTRVVRAVVEQSRLAVGVNMLRNGCVEALSVAHAAGARFIRCNIMVGAYATDQGIIEGCAAELLRVKRLLGADTLLLGDVHVKHAHPLFDVPIEYAAQDLAERGGADAVIVSGPRSPIPPSEEALASVKNSVGKPVLVGSGITLGNVRRFYELCDGLIIGEPDFKVGGKWGGASDSQAYRKAVTLCRGTS